MKITLLHLNIEEGKQLDRIAAYVKQNNIDILHFQEISGGKHNFRGIDSFPEVKSALGYEGIQAVFWHLKDDPATYMSNTTFFKPELKPISSRIEFLLPFRELSEAEMNQYEDHPTNVLDVVFTFNGQKIHFLNTHLLWGPRPNDTPLKIEQGKKLYDYIKGLAAPFVLSGDFNVTADSQIVQMMNELGVNHTVEHGITNTLNGNLHRVKSLFPAGLAVDFLYTEKSLNVIDFKLVDTPDLSDHYGLEVTIEV